VLSVAAARPTTGENGVIRDDTVRRTTNSGRSKISSGFKRFINKRSGEPFDEPPRRAANGEGVQLEYLGASADQDWACTEHRDTIKS